MFLSKDQREAKRVINEKIKELESLLQQAQSHYAARLESKNDDIQRNAISLSDKWEYLELDDITSEGLNMFGSLGWELLAVTFFDHIANDRRAMFFRYVFKRKKYPIPETILSQYNDMPAIENDIRRISSEIEALKKQR